MIDDFSINTCDPSLRKKAFILVILSIIFILYIGYLIYTEFSERTLTNIISLILIIIFFVFLFLISIYTIFDKIQYKNGLLSWHTIYTINKLNIDLIKNINFIDKGLSVKIWIQLKNGKQYFIRINNPEALDYLSKLDNHIISLNNCTAHNKA